MEMRWIIIMGWFQAGLSVHCLLWLRKSPDGVQSTACAPRASVWVTVGGCCPLPVPAQALSCAAPGLVWAQLQECRGVRGESSAPFGGVLSADCPIHEEIPLPWAL